MRQGRRRLRIERGQLDGARLHPPQRVDERRHVEVVAQDFTIGFEQRRERAEPRCDRQVSRPFPLLPQRSPSPGTPPRQEQSACGGFAETCRKERRGAELPENKSFHVVGIREQQRRVRRRLDVGERRRTPRRPTSLRHPCRCANGFAPSRPWPTVRECGCRAARGGTPASPRDHRGIVR